MLGGVELEDGFLHVHTQADVDDLEGCEEVPFDLVIGTLETALDLRPLHALRVARGQMSIVGVSSLEGLEALERVDQGLYLDNLQTSSLRPLMSLTSVGRYMDGPRSGGLNIVACNQLVELEGLDRLRTFTGLRLALNENLRSVGSLPIPRVMDSIVVQWNPRLEDLGAVGAVESALELTIEGNAALVGVQSQLESVGALHIQSNAALRHIELSRLRRAAEPEGSAPLPGVRISFNPRLETLQLEALERTSSLVVQQNVALHSLLVGALSEVEELVIGTNLALEPAALSLKPALTPSFERVAGNGPATTARPMAENVDALLLDPCPWSNDGYCDGCRGLAFPICHRKLCSIQSDSADCP